VARYVYHCDKCEKTLVISHLSDETQTQCPECSSAEGFKKVLTSFSTSTGAKARKQKVGQITEEFIENSREELRQQRKDLDKAR